MFPGLGVFLHHQHKHQQCHIAIVLEHEYFHKIQLIVLEFLIRIGFGEYALAVEIFGSLSSWSAT